MTQAAAHVVPLAWERQPGLIISDDRTVRAQAQSLDLAVIGTIGILLDARRDGHHL
jgi:predicted nucleic acid-binding protein